MQAKVPEVLTSSNSNLDEMLANLSDEQEELLIVLMRDLSKFMYEEG